MQRCPFLLLWRQDRVVWVDQVIPRNQELWAVGRSRWLAVRFCHSHGSRGFYTSFGVDPSHTLPSPQSVLVTQGISERSSWDMQPAGSSRGASQRFLDRTWRAVSTSVRSLAFAPPALPATLWAQARLWRMYYLGGLLQERQRKQASCWDLWFHVVKCIDTWLYCLPIPDRRDNKGIFFFKRQSP